MNPKKQNILIVDDNPANLIALCTVLKGLDVNLVKASSGEEALSHLLRESFAMILLDVWMPGMDGYETAEYIRQSEDGKHLPIIFITADDEMDKNNLYTLDEEVFDYIFKPIDSSKLIRKVKQILSELINE